MTEQDIKTALEQINSRLTALEGAALLPKKAPLSANSMELWTVKEIARYSGYSYRYTMITLINLPDFPSSVGNQGKHTRKRYIAGDIIRYFAQRKTANKRGEL